MLTVRRCQSHSETSSPSGKLRELAEVVIPRTLLLRVVIPLAWAGVVDTQQLIVSNFNQHDDTCK